jgi:hypothetical protein
MRIELDRDDDFEGWFLYLATFPIPGDDDVMLKVGITALPMDRFAGLRVGSCFEFREARFALVGGRGAATALEKDLLRGLAELRTHGEWVRIAGDLVPRVQAAADRIYREQEGRLFAWRSTDLEAVMAHTAYLHGLKAPATPKRRRHWSDALFGTRRSAETTLQARIVRALGSGPMTLEQLHAKLGAASVKRDTLSQTLSRCARFERVSTGWTLADLSAAQGTLARA